jgi:hypothetical protein
MLVGVQRTAHRAAFAVFPISIRLHYGIGFLMSLHAPDVLGTDRGVVVIGQKSHVWLPCLVGEGRLQCDLGEQSVDLLCRLQCVRPHLAISLVRALAHNQFILELPDNSILLTS